MTGIDDLTICPYYKYDERKDNREEKTRKRYIARDWGIIETEFNDEPRKNYIWGHFETISSITDLLNKLHIQNCEKEHEIDLLIQFLLDNGFTLEDYNQWLVGKK